MFKDMYFSSFSVRLCTRIRISLREKSTYTQFVLICLNLAFSSNVLRIHFHLCTMQLRVFFYKFKYHYSEATTFKRKNNFE